jgi:hypothetical protein
VNGEKGDDMNEDDSLSLAGSTILWRAKMLVGEAKQASGCFFMYARQLSRDVRIVVARSAACVCVCVCVCVYA